MADAQKTQVRLEIAHVLFMDIVGYSKLLIDEQSEALQELNRIVRTTETARNRVRGSAYPPSGDGMALVFTGSVEEPVECASPISFRPNFRLTRRWRFEKPPTKDVAAFDLYSRAKTLLLTTAFSFSQDKKYEEAIQDLNGAIARDPSFFAAYCQLVFAHDTIYALVDHTPTRLSLAENALAGAARLQPNAPEMHLARAWHFYYGRRDYKAATAELEIARQGLANDPRIFETTGYILRRQGKQEEALRNLERAVELDPRNAFILTQISISYQFLRRYPEDIAMLDRALAITPNDVAPSEPGGS